MTTTRQDKEFLEDVISSTLLESAIDWITGNMAPDEVFHVSDLKTWAEENGYQLKEE